METETVARSDRASTAVTIILCVLFIPTILINAAMIIKTFVHPDHIPGVFGIKPVIVLSGSMSPTFEANSLVFVKKTDPELLKLGDIICYLNDGAAITHRIEQVVAESGGISYITRGDANNTTDRLAVAPEQIEGKYIGHIAGLGGFGIFMQSTAGTIIFIILPIALYLIWDIARRSQENKKQKSRTQMLQAEIERLKAQERIAAEELRAKEDVSME